MSGAQTNGGPAFPCPVGHIECAHPEGMSLRDYFAAKAQEGFIASLPQGIEPAEIRTGMARDCYEIADAMIAARGVA